MKTTKVGTLVSAALCCLVGVSSIAWSAQPQPLRQYPERDLRRTPVPSVSPGIAPRLAPRVSLCTVYGSLKLDPTDHTNGYLHYKGEVTFKANRPLEGVNVHLKGPKYACYCEGCPSGSSHATGLQPEGRFSAGETRTFTVDCPSWRQPLSGPLGKGSVKYFVSTSSPAGVFKRAECSGIFHFGR